VPDWLKAVLGVGFSGFAIRAYQGIAERARRARRRRALQLRFEDTDAPPYLVELYDRGKTWRCYRVGLSNADEEPLHHARVIVEEVQRHKGQGWRLDQRLRQSNDYSDSTSVISQRSAKPVTFDLVEQWHEGGTPSDWAWLCVADKEPKGLPMLPFGKSKVLLRAEADGVEPVRLALYLQTRTPRADTLSGERDVQRTHVLVRRAE
jgi:hypothetical protein